MSKNERLDVERGSGNVYRDLGMPEAETRQLRAELAAEIIRIIKSRKLSQRKAAGVTGLAQPDISRIKNADLGGFTIDRLIGVLNRLDRHVELRIHPAGRRHTPEYA